MAAKKIVMSSKGQNYTFKTILLLYKTKSWTDYFYKVLSKMIRIIVS